MLDKLIFITPSSHYIIWKFHKCKWGTQYTCKFIHLYMYIKYERQNVMFGRILFLYKAQPASTRLPVLHIGGHSLLSNGLDTYRYWLGVARHADECQLQLKFLVTRCWLVYLIIINSSSITPSQWPRSLRHKKFNSRRRFWGDFRYVQ